MLDTTLIGVLAARDGLISHDALPHTGGSEGEKDEKPGGREVLDPADYAELKTYVQDVVRQQFRLEDIARARDPVVRGRFKNIVLHAVQEKGLHVEEPDVPVLVQKLFDDILGYGPLEKFFFDPEITEIQVNGTEIRTVRHGRREKAGVRFESVAHAREVLERMLAPSGRRLDLASPRVNARLFDGSRLIAQIAPVAVDGVLISIRRFRQDVTADMLIHNRAVSSELMQFLRACVVARLNIVISGGTGSGKTTIINILGSFIPEDESIITIEDPAELQLQHSDVRRLEARPANIEGQGEITQQDLMADTLRMYPDRIIIGECRRGEAFEMLQAMNTGHLGSMTSVHANSAWHCIDRMVNMVQMARMNLPYNAIIDQIAGAIDIIVHVTRDKTGRRRIDHVVETAGVKKSAEGLSYDVILNPLWQYNQATDTFDWVAEKFLRAEKLERVGWACPS
ncbi:MAG: CpaF family protein [Moorellaceae bacterium]